MSNTTSKIMLIKTFKEFLIVNEDLKKIMDENFLNSYMNTIDSLKKMNIKFSNLHDSDIYKRNLIEQFEDLVNKHAEQTSQFNLISSNYNNIKTTYTTLIEKIYNENVKEFNKKATEIDNNLVKAENEFFGLIKKENHQINGFLEDLKQKSNSLKEELGPKPSFMSLLIKKANELAKSVENEKNEKNDKSKNESDNNLTK